MRVPIFDALPALFVLTMACSSTITLRSIEDEGDDVGECSDGADNDGDGLFDCEDDDCAGSDDCCDDADNDGICAADDRCPAGDDSLDADGDGVPNACDPCPSDLVDDSDNDGVCDSQDLCPGFRDDVDSDGDQVADGCDPCPEDANDDSDNDGICDRFDICAGADDLTDSDGDGVPDGCDLCPDDVDDDSDGDNVCDSDDVCDGFDDALDPDLDGVPDGCDLCPLDLLDDSDGDGVCDSDDLCQGADDGLDLDSDGVPDACDDDDDGDGWTDLDDCDDRDATVHPLAGDTYGDGVDPDCDGEDCDAGFVGSTYFTTCPGSGDQATSDAACIAQGYDGLASVFTGEEDAYINAQGVTSWNKWLGGSDAEAQFSWKWGRDYAFRFANWAPGMPVNDLVPADGDCMVLNARNSASAASLWAPIVCNSVAPAVEAYVCELRCVGDGDVDGDGRCDTDDSCFGENQAADLDQDGICDDVDAFDSQLLLAMPFEGSMADVSASGFTPVPQDSFAYTPALTGTGGYFDGTVGRIDTGLTYIDVGVSVAFWYRLDAGPTGFYGTLIDKGRDLKLQYNNTGDWIFFGDNLPPVTYVTAPSNVWHHLVYVADGSLVHHYIDGVEVSVGVPYVRTILYQMPLVIGNVPDVFNDGQVFDGAFDDVRYYNRALSPSEVAILAGGAP